MIVYAVSNFSVTRGAAVRGSVATGAATAATATAADVEVVLDGDVTVGDEIGAARAAQERGADAVVSAIEAMQAQLERMKQAAIHAAPANKC